MPSPARDEGSTARTALTYPEVAVTREGPLPAGYRHLHVRHRLGRGDLAAIGRGLLTWRVHAAAHVRVDADTPVAEVGADVRTLLGAGPLRLVVPCQVVWVETAERTAGFAYGSLPGHPFTGEESFRVERDDDGVLWFVVDAFSRPAWRWLVPLAWTVPLVQHAYLRLLAHGARRLVRAG